MKRVVVLLALSFATGCIVNNNQSPGAVGTVAPNVPIEPQVGIAMPGGSAQANRSGPNGQR